MRMKMRNEKNGFTLVELLVVIGIIAILASIAMPAYQTSLAKADSIGCMANLRQIGIATQNYLTDHDNTYPFIEPNPKISQIYPSQVGAKSILDTFSPYGVTTKTLQCPSDMKQPQSSYAKYGSSYIWDPMSDGEANSGSINLTQIFGGGRGGGGGRQGFSPQISLAHIQLVADQTPLHHGKVNILFADGHTVHY